MRWPNLKYLLALPLLLTFLPVSAIAGPRVEDAVSNPLVQVLLAIAIMLLFCIILLGYVLNGAADVYREKLKKQKEENKTGIVVPITLLLLALSSQAIAQDAPTPETINGLTYPAFYLLVGVIIFEILVIMIMVLQLRYLAGLTSGKAEAKAAAKAAAEAKPKANWWWKLNKSVSLDREKEIDLSHDYDGIRELDNKVPPWWQLAFLFSVLFGVVYVYRYHIAGSAPLQMEEFELAMKKGEEDRQAYLRKSAGNVDENTITIMDASAIAAGKSIFDANCVACHGTAGEGNAVGPNLTDKFWIHGGDIKDIFKTVKYGWPEKGMQSWKEILSPVKIAQVSNYIVSIQGSNPANPKEPQGEIYEPAAAAPAAVDSTAADK